RPGIARTSTSGFISRRAIRRCGSCPRSRATACCCTARRRWPTSLRSTTRPKPGTRATCYRPCRATVTCSSVWKTASTTTRVYGGTGKAARDWASFDAICRSLRALENDETLLVQSGKPVGVFRTHPDAPRVLIANSNLVGRWASWEVFRDLEKKGLIMYGQMTAGSWIYIGTQGILQGTYETLGAVAQRHFGGSLRGRVLLTGGLGGMGGAQPLAVTMHDGVCLAVEVDPARVQRRLDTRYLDRATASLDEALHWCEQAKRQGKALSVGLIGNCAAVLPELERRRIVPDILTDQTSAHDPLNGYI